MNNKIDTPFVSVVIPVYNGERFIQACITALLKQSYPKDRYEIVVVDNGSSDNTVEIVKQHDIVFAASDIKGPSAARNAGISKAVGDIVIFTDADCIADYDFIKEHVATHRYYRSTDLSVKAVGGGIAGINKSFWALCDDFCCWYNFHSWLRSRTFNSGHVPTANMSVSRELIEEIGLFNEELLYSEDSEYCLRIFNHGYKITFKPSAKIKHINRTGFKQFLYHSKSWAENYSLLLQKKIVKPRKNPLLFYSLGLSFLVARIFWYAVLAFRFHVIFCLPFIAVNQLLRVKTFIKEELTYKKLNTGKCN